LISSDYEEVPTKPNVLAEIVLRNEKNPTEFAEI
jgi:hypothetical protein